MAPRDPNAHRERPLPHLRVHVHRIRVRTEFGTRSDERSYIESLVEALHIEPEVHHIAVLHDVLLAFKAQLPRSFHSRLVLVRA